MKFTQQRQEGANFIRRYGADFIVVGEQEIRTSCIVGVNSLTPWAPRSVEELGAELRVTDAFGGADRSKRKVRSTDLLQQPATPVTHVLRRGKTQQPAQRRQLRRSRRSNGHALLGQKKVGEDQRESLHAGIVSDR